MWMKSQDRRLDRLPQVSDLVSGIISREDEQLTREESASPKVDIPLVPVAIDRMKYHAASKDPKVSHVPSRFIGADRLASTALANIPSRCTACITRPERKERGA
jgi:hypothetical protein